MGHATVGLLPGRASCYRSLISTSSSRCRIISRIWRWSTRRSSTTCCSTPLPRPCSRSRPTPNISAHRSVSWLCCTVAQLGSELVVPSSSPLSDSGRRSFPRPHPLDPSPLSLLPAGGRVLRRVFRGKFVDALQRRFQQHQLIFPGSLRPLQNERAFRAFLRPLFRQNWMSMPNLRSAVPIMSSAISPLYSSCRHLQPSPGRLHQPPSDLPLERLCPRKSQENDDGRGARVLAPFPAACTAPRLRPHPFLWLPGQPSPRHPLIALSTLIVGSSPAGHYPSQQHSPSPSMLPLSATCHAHAAPGISFCLGRCPTPAPKDPT